MKKVVLLFIVLTVTVSTHAQYKLELLIRNSEDSLPISGATAILKEVSKTTLSDSQGLALFTDIPKKKYTLTISHTGFSAKQIITDISSETALRLNIFLYHDEKEEDEVIITSTRLSRTIGDIPTRVETISGEEIVEKANMKPGDIRLMLSESTGIQTQQTSATSYSSSIRIQGLDGRYTQLLRDGFPLYSGFSGGLSLMQVAPLDLKQVEIIKGSSSTLYGGGAISGLIDLVSKTPVEKRELSFIANATSARGLDLSTFYSQRFKKLGVTVFGSRNSGVAYDPAGIGLTAIPEFERYTINPRLFIYGDKTNVNAGFSYITEDRVGGSMNYIKMGEDGYYEKNNTDRFTTQFDITHKLNEYSNLEIKSSYTNFNRLIKIPAYFFEGVQQSSYSELTYSSGRNKLFWIFGANFLTDQFKEKPNNSDEVRSYDNKTIGGFIQNTWLPIPFFSLETGLRGDYVKQYGFVVLPRISGMFKITPKFTARLGGGFGYKTPSVFNEEAERLQFQHILPINEILAKNERSMGGNLDFNYRTNLGAVGLTINQLFFYTRLNSPLVLTAAEDDSYEFKNANGHIDSKGMETNLRFTYMDFKLFIGYTNTDVNSHYNQTRQWLPLTSKHRLNNVLMYEKEGNLKIGLEAYYTSPQQLNDGKTGKAFWTSGLMAEKFWNNFSVFINFENMFDVRQTKFDTLYSGTIDNPVFRDIYAPVDGFLINGGIKLRL